MISILKHRVVPAALMSLMVIFLSSCGYHMGSMMHPQIKTVHNGSLVIYSFGIPCPDPEAAFETEECVSILLKSRAPHGQLMPLDRRRSTVCAILFGAFRHWSGFPVFRCLRLGQFIFLGYPDSPFLCIIQAKTPA